MFQYVANHLPMNRLEELRSVYRAMAKEQGKRLRIRFRGPRYDYLAAYCRKEHARYFAVYFV